jgi:hypothetical protein
MAILGGSGVVSNIATVAGISGNVTTVAGIASNVTSVASNASNIIAAVSNASNINAAVANASNITAAVNNATNINTVAGSNTNINTVAGSIANVNTTAANIAGVNSFAERWRVASSAPSSSLQEGDLYFNTSNDTVFHYNGSAWVAISTYSVQDGQLSQNNFTNADHSKLDGIENNATADQTNAQIKTAVQAGSDIALAGNPTTTTQSANNNSTRIATTAYADSAIAALSDSAPATLNTLNELAAALGDDANYATTTTNAIAAKLAKAGGTMTGALTLSGNPSSANHASNKAYVDLQIAAVPDAVAMAIALG